MILDKDIITGALKVSGELDVDAANSLREALLDCFSSQTEVALDLASVSMIDTAALQVLLAGPREAAFLGKSFRFVAVSPSVTETAAALGFSIKAPHALGDALEHAL
jgi:anti-anti-sigma factor